MESETFIRHFLSIIPKDSFNDLVIKNATDYSLKSLSTYDYFTTLVFAYLSGYDSLRQICSEISKIPLKTLQSQLFMQKAPTKSSLSYASTKRHWHFFREVYKMVKKHIGDLEVNSKKKDKSLEFDDPLNIIDWPTLELCHEIFDWKKYRSTKGALRGPNGKLFSRRISSAKGPTKEKRVLKREKRYLKNEFFPIFLTISNKSEIKKDLDDYKSLYRNSFVVINSFCDNIGLLDTWNNNHIRYIMKSPKAIKNFKILRTRTLPDESAYPKSYSFSKIKVMEDIEIMACISSNQRTPSHLRRLTFFNTEKKITLLTNDVNTDTRVLVDIFVHHEEVSIFFKMIKNQLFISSFLGTSLNAILTQTYVALTAQLILHHLVQQSGKKITARYFFKKLPKILFSDFSRFSSEEK
ncbi:MAG: DUF4372 domain-containing protein [Deltaproteobacteria bacterium]|jgi:hypothetical protein|nr:DUF4372 domain-containing protein [Deltaproteobacteria bacterium]